MLLNFEARTRPKNQEPSCRDVIRVMNIHAIVVENIGKHKQFRRNIPGWNFVQMFIAAVYQISVAGDAREPEMHEI